MAHVFPHCGRRLRYLAAGDHYVCASDGSFYLDTTGRLESGPRPA